MKKRSDMYISTLECTVCGSKFPIPRRASKKREKNHLKRIFCYKCNKRQNFIENKENENEG